MQLGTVDATNARTIEDSVRKTADEHVKHHPEDADHVASYERGLLVAALEAAADKIRSLEQGRVETKVFVVWGENPEAGAEPFEYSFATRAEANAFRIGICEAQGWGDAAAFETAEEAQAYLEEVAV